MKYLETAALYQVLMKTSAGSVVELTVAWHGCDMGSQGSAGEGLDHEDSTETPLW